jgi:hypothetical protein
VGRGEGLQILRVLQKQLQTEGDGANSSPPTNKHAKIIFQSWDGFFLTYYAMENGHQIWNLEWAH